jgi:hypothetical protein
MKVNPFDEKGSTEKRELSYSYMSYSLLLAPRTQDVCTA